MMEFIEYLPTGSIETLHLIPDGDLIIVLGNTQDAAYEEWLQSMLNIFRCAGSNVRQNAGIPDEIHVLVSKSVMTAISVAFERMLNHNGQKRRYNGIRVYAEDDDESDSGEAMLIILLVIFGKSKFVPKNVPLLALRDICVVIGKFMLQDAVELITKTWASKLKHDWRNESDLQNIEAGLTIAHVLRHTFMMDAALQAFFMHSTTWLSLNDLPFPETLFRSINESYRMLLEKLHEDVNALIDGPLALWELPSHNVLRVAFTTLSSSSDVDNRGRNPLQPAPSIYGLLNLFRSTTKEPFHVETREGLARIRLELEIDMAKERASLLAMWKD